MRLAKQDDSGLKKKRKSFGRDIVEMGRLFPMNLAADFINVCDHSQINFGTDFCCPSWIEPIFYSEFQGCFPSSELMIYSLFKKWSLELESLEVNPNPVTSRLGDYEKFT